MFKEKLFLFVMAGFLAISLCHPEEAKQKNLAKLDIKIDQIVSSDYPSMTAYVVVKNEKGALVTDLAPGLFVSRIDNQKIKAKIKVAPFSMMDEGVDYTILMSNNGIMEGEPLDFQKTAILQFAELLNPKDTLSLYTIGEEATAVFEDLSRKTFDPAPVNKIGVSGVQPRVYDSLLNILRKVAQKKVQRKVIIIMSDGRDQGSRFTKEQLDTALASTGLPVYAIGMKVLSVQSLSALNQIADSTGGTYIYAGQARNIPDGLKSIMESVIKGYVVTYRVKSVKADNTPHLLEISVNEHDATGAGKKTFVAVKLPVPKWLQVLIVIIIVLVIALLIFIAIYRKIQRRKNMGITRRRCPDCGMLMKDNWDSCPFCKYKPEMKKKKKKIKIGKVDV